MADSPEQVELKALSADNVLLRGDIEKLSKDISGYLDTQKSELKQFGATMTKTGDDLKKAHEDWDLVAKDMADVKERQQKLELKVDRRNLGGGGLNTREKLKSLGQMLVSSEQFKQMQKDRVLRCHGVKTKSLRPFSRAMFRKAMNPLMLKDVDDPHTSANIGALVQEFRWEQIISQVLRPTRIRDLITSITVNSNSVEYPEENILHLVQGRIGVALTGGESIVTLLRVDGTSSAAGFTKGEKIVVGTNTANEEEHLILSVDYVTGVVTLDGTTIANTHPIGGKAASDHFNFTPEAQVKACAHMEFINRTQAIKTLATLIPVSKQMLDDFTGLQQYIDARLELFLDISEERQLLYGDDSSREIQGILTHPDVPPYLWSSGAPGDTKLDGIRRSFTVVRLAFFPVDAVVLSPQDWEDIELEKGNDKHYVFFQVQTGPGIPVIWRAQVIESSVIKEEDWLAGSFQMGAIIWDREEAQIMVSDSHKDWFELNLVAVRAEQRMAQSIIRPKSFVAGKFDAQP